MVSDGAARCGCSLARHVYESQKSVPVSRDGFDIAWTLRGIAEGGAQLGHGFVEAAIKIDERVGRPKFVAEFLAGYDFPGMFQQKRENLEGLLLQLDSNTAFAGLGRVDDAAGAYENAIVWQKNAATKNPGPYIDMGSLLLDLNRSTEAITYLKQAIEISPLDFKPHELLGKAYSRLHQLAEAQNELEQAIALAPQNPNLPCMLGPLYHKQGLSDKAKVQLDRCTTMSGTHSLPETPRP